MSDIKSVVSFFIGLLLFAALVFLALTKLKPAPKSSVKPSPSPTIIITPTTTAQKQQTILEKLKQFFAKKTSLTPSAIPTKTLLQGKEIKPTVVLINETPEAGGSAVYAEGAKGVVTIPESGAPTLLIPLSFLLGSAGIFLRRKN